MTLELLIYSLLLFTALFVIGTLLCLALYKWEYARFFHSALWTKVLYWIPIFLIFLAILYLQLWAAAFITLVIIYFAIREVLRLSQKSWLAWIYMIAISLALTHLILFFAVLDSQQSVTVLLVVGFSSVMSDVCAYFFGNFFGRHKLPNQINPNKSWEGVAGQLIGACIGFLLIVPVLHPAPSFVLAILVGLASALGDILNSVVKRRMGIKDWGTTIPGHGGVLDRFASLAFAIAVAFWWTILF
ncbi:MAG: Phosphatidate cytidylyltransferase [Candidatus Saccharibacteria bacterium GW2011_GWC2_48_9]|nr:MAG: Phosphatidate cytidylyltransferase [Candidatus Saccharibacteria bacterium GW2011_GWC2_48_9]HCH34893.1 hypothetical protein [Candidatus Saccharibacteria bacterium]